MLLGPQAHPGLHQWPSTVPIVLGVVGHGQVGIDADGGPGEDGGISQNSSGGGSDSLGLVVGQGQVGIDDSSGSDTSSKNIWF